MLSGGVGAGMRTLIGFIAGLCLSFGLFVAPAALYFGVDPVMTMRAVRQGLGNVDANRTELYVCGSPDRRGAFVAPSDRAVAATAGCTIDATPQAKRDAQKLSEFFQMSSWLGLAPPWDPRLAENTESSRRYQKNRDTAIALQKLYSDAMAAKEVGAFIERFYKEHPTFDGGGPEDPSLEKEFARQQGEVASKLMAEPLKSLRKDGSHDAAAIDIMTACLLHQEPPGEGAREVFGIFGELPTFPETYEEEPFEPTHITGYMHVDERDVNVMSAAFPDLGEGNIGCGDIDYGYFGGSNE